MANEKLSNEAFLELFIEQPQSVPEYLLLPHELVLIEKNYSEKVAQFDKIVSDKEHVTGGDDWHDGAFRATDNEALILSERLAKVNPFLTATVVEYPDAGEERATLGSRVFVTQNGFTFPVDIVGSRHTYPEKVTDPDSDEDVTGVSPDSPLGGNIIGKKVGEDAVYRNGDRKLQLTIDRIDQLAVPRFFLDACKVSISTSGQDH